MIVSRAAASITGQHPEKNGVISQVFKVYVSEIFLSSLIALLSISHTRVSSNKRVRRLRVCVCTCLDILVRTENRHAAILVETNSPYGDKMLCPPV